MQRPLEKIDAITAARALGSRDGAQTGTQSGVSRGPAAPPPPADVDPDLVADDGRVRLTLSDALLARLRAGGELVLRGETTSAGLKLLIGDARADPGRPEKPPADASNLAALRADQLNTRIVQQALPKAAELAVAWRAQVHAALTERGHPSRRDLADREVPLPVADSASWRVGAGHPERTASIPVQLAQLPIVLHIFHSDTEEERSRARQRRVARTLRLDFVLGRVGPVTVLLELVPGGVAVTLGVEGRNAWPEVCDWVGAISIALRKAELPLIRYQLTGSLPRLAPAARRPHGGTNEGLVLPLPLFRAAAEVVLALQPTTA